MLFNPSGNVGKPQEVVREENWSLAGKPQFKPGQAPVIPVQVAPQSGPIRAWSISTLFKFEQCPHQVFLEKVQKVPVETKNEAADRGVKVHAKAEAFVRGELGELPKDLQKFTSSFMQLREQFEEGLVEVEGDWAYDVDWQPVAWVHPTVWARQKLDAFIRESETSAIIVDYKTGKKFGNEMKHKTQGISYAIGAFFRFPELDFIRVEFWYLDEGSTLVGTYTRAQAMALLPKLEERATKLTSCVNFPPKPNKHNCKFCPFITNGCEWGVN